MAHFTFVPQYESGPGPKRRRIARACDRCRATKKRCMHCDGALALYQQDTAGTSQSHRASISTDTDDVGSSGERPTSQRDHAATPSASASSPSQRFIGDLNPEARLLDQQSPYDKDTHRVSAGDIGVWVDRAPTQTDSVDQTPQSTVSSLIVPVADAFALANVYFSKINVMLPIIDEAEFRASQSTANTNPALVHAICLVAAKDKQAEPHLKLYRTPEVVLPSRQYCTELYEAVVEALAPRSKIDKPTLIRVHALLSLHNEGSDGAEQASVHVSQAMHFAQSLGLHLLRPADKEVELKKLFWCLWTLDRLNAAINGRPIIMSDIDIAIEPLAPEQTGSVAFDMWLRIAHLLNDVIALYRPSNVHIATGWEHDYTGFEQIVHELGGADLPSSLLATIHAFYLAVAVLSHRSKTLKTLPHLSASCVRRNLSAIYIIRLMSTKERQEALYPMHVLPFAASLALSVSYQQLRQAQLPHQQEDARNDFLACCRILQDLRQKWGAADVMAALGRKVSLEIDRMPSLAAVHMEPQYTERQLLTGKDGHEFSLEGAQQAAQGEEVGIFRGIDPPSACPTLTATDAADADPAAEQAQAQITSGMELFEGMDDIFGMYLDPNNPVNFDDMPFLDAQDQQLFGLG